MADGIVVLPDGILIEVKTRLTPRQVDVLRLKLRGYTAREVSEVLYISRRTVETHWSDIRETLNITSVKGLVEWAERNGLVEYYL